MQNHFSELLAAYLRGLGLDPTDDPVRVARAHALRIQAFKRKAGPPRVPTCLGILRGLNPSELLDVGCGRGTFLWPLVQAFPWLPVTAVDALPHRIAVVQAVAAGGIHRLQGLRTDVTALPFGDDQFDVCTILEVLEHLEDPAAAAREVVRVARRFVLASVPSKPDDNPEHIQLFTVERLTELFLSAGARKVQIQHILNHRIAVVSLEGPCDS